MGRGNRRAISQETVEILEQETYQYQGQTTSIVESLMKMRQGTRTYTPTDLKKLVEQQQIASPNETQFEVRNCTTFAAAKSLVDDGHKDVLCLNFASAKNPGGGFLNGDQAQEECLARASGLYQSLLIDQTYYEVNRANRSPLYTNHLIYSPSVPVFRDDEDQLLKTPYEVAIVTSPAVNAGAVRKNHPNQVSRIEPMMQERIRSVLAVAYEQGHRTLVLGAWGCGVFQNDPRKMAEWFYDTLIDDIRFRGAFERIVFAVLDRYGRETPTYDAFENVFQFS